MRLHKVAHDTQVYMDVCCWELQLERSNIRAKHLTLAKKNIDTLRDSNESSENFTNIVLLGHIYTLTFDRSE